MDYQDYSEQEKVLVLYAHLEGDGNVSGRFAPYVMLSASLRALCSPIVLLCTKGFCTSYCGCQSEKVGFDLACGGVSLFAAAKYFLVRSCIPLNCELVARYVFSYCSLALNRSAHSKSPLS